MSRLDDIEEEILEKLRDDLVSAGEKVYGWSKIGCGTLIALWIGGCIVGRISDSWTPIVDGCKSKIHQGIEESRQRVREHQEAEEAEVARKEQERKAQEAEALRISKLKAERESRAKKDVGKKRRVEEFAVKEAPQIWSTLKVLRGELEVQDRKLAELKSTLEDFDRKPEDDADYKKMCEMKSVLSESVAEIYRELEDAYIAAKKFEVAPGAKEYADLRARAIRDGIQEAEAAIRHFDEMRKQKQ